MKTWIICVTKAKLCALRKAEQSSKSAWLPKEITVLLQQLNTSSKSNILIDCSTVIFLTKFDFPKSKTKLQSITWNNYLKQGLLYVD